jgi:tRNA U34 2-thiouridine synthase MnmA/TrmU
MKAIGLLSGGLDSTLALKIILGQGIEVIALNFFTPFCRCVRGGCSWAKRQADHLKIPIKTVYLGEEYLEIVKNPKFGYGSQLNPCIDCRILMFRKAREFMKEVDASFIVTGEVLGQRPMSQNLRALKLIEREAGLEGLIVRPLSAKLLPPAIPEEKGWVKREELLAIKGRSRKEQMRIAAEVGLRDYPCPAGGCLLTDPGFAKRMRDLMEYSPNFTLEDIELLKIGRHFRLAPETKLVVGRNYSENTMLEKMLGKGDVMLYIKEFKGPIAVMKGKTSTELLKTAARITVRYSDAPQNAEVKVSYKSNNILDFIKVKAAEVNEVEKFLVK